MAANDLFALELATDAPVALLVMILSSLLNGAKLPPAYSGTMASYVIRRRHVIRAFAVKQQFPLPTFKLFGIGVLNKNG